MSNQNRYYLFKSGKLTGPLSQSKIEEMRSNGKILTYSWMMDETTQTWSPIEGMPTENPFQASLQTLKERILSGAFQHRGKALSGIVKGMHSFGLEILMPKESRDWNGLSTSAPLLLNLVDETHLKTSNAKVTFQAAEATSEGTLLRFSWHEAAAPL